MSNLPYYWLEPRSAPQALEKHSESLYKHVRLHIGIRIKVCCIAEIISIPVSHTYNLSLHIYIYIRYI